MSLTLQQRNRMRLALERAGHVRRAFLVEGGERPLLAFEYDQRPATVEEAQARLDDLVAAVAPSLGAAAGSVGSSAGGPEDIARVVSGARIVYERAEP